MKVMLDLNVLLDVLQRREPHYTDSAAVLSLALGGHIEACLPGHAITTIHSLVGKTLDKSQADQAIDWLLRHFDIAGADKPVLIRARGYAMADFEDAVVASLAVNAACSSIVTRNVRDFQHSPVPALSPAELLVSLG